MINLGVAHEHLSSQTHRSSAARREAWKDAGLWYWKARDLSQPAPSDLDSKRRCMPFHVETWKRLAWCDVVEKKVDVAKWELDQAERCAVAGGLKPMAEDVRKLRKELKNAREQKAESSKTV